MHYKLDLLSRAIIMSTIIAHHNRPTMDYKHRWNKIAAFIRYGRDVHFLKNR